MGEGLEEDKEATGGNRRKRKGEEREMERQVKEIKRIEDCRAPRKGGGSEGRVGGQEARGGNRRKRKAEEREMTESVRKKEGI